MGCGSAEGPTKNQANNNNTRNRPFFLQSSRAYKTNHMAKSRRVFVWPKSRATRGLAASGPAGPGARRETSEVGNQRPDVGIVAEPTTQAGGTSGKRAGVRIATHRPKITAVRCFRAPHIPLPAGGVASKDARSSGIAAPPPIHPTRSLHRARHLTAAGLRVCQPKSSLEVIVSFIRSRTWIAPRGAVGMALGFRERAWVKDTMDHEIAGCEVARMRQAERTSRVQMTVPSA